LRRTRRYERAGDYPNHPPLIRGGEWIGIFGSRYRAVTHLDVTPEDIDEALARIADAVGSV
jgi:threonine aldolase